MKRHAKTIVAILALLLSISVILFLSQKGGKINSGDYTSLDGSARISTNDDYFTKIFWVNIYAKTKNSKLRWKVHVNCTYPPDFPSNEALLALSRVGKIQVGNSASKHNPETPFSAIIRFYDEDGFVIDPPTNPDGSPAQRFMKPVIIPDSDSPKGDLDSSEYLYHQVEFKGEIELTPSKVGDIESTTLEVMVSPEFQEAFPASRTSAPAGAQ